MLAFIHQIRHFKTKEDLILISDLRLCNLTLRLSKEMKKVDDKQHVMQHWGVLTAADRWSDCMLVILEELRLVLLPSSHTEKARGEIKYSVLGVLIFMYIHCGEHFLKMNNHRRKGHRCAEVVHYGSGIIAFLTLVPIVMKSWQWPDVEWQITLWFNHASVGARVWVSAVGGVGVGHLPFLKKEKEKKKCVSPPKSPH